jgi:hypothetical protein
LGACCVHGDSGAPLEQTEKELIEQHIAKIAPYLTDEARSVIDRCGVAVIDVEYELVTPLIGDNAECVYSFFSDKGVCMCGIEKAYRNGDIPFNKPISCHLYPIRVTEYAGATVLNYDQWQLCSAATELGNKNKIPVFRFLKDPIIRKFGEKFFDEMSEVEKLLRDKN